jgi:APA family basic amino acid/polyamine antiporter
VRRCLGSSGVTVFTTLVLMTGITSAVPYLFSALAQLKWRLLDGRQVETPRLVRDVIVAVLVVVFSALFIWYSRYTGQGFWIYWAPFFLTIVAFALGVPVYRAQRRAMIAPGGMPPYRPIGSQDEVIDPVSQRVRGQARPRPHG